MICNSLLIKTDLDRTLDEILDKYRGIAKSVKSPTITKVPSIKFHSLDMWRKRKS